MADEQRHRAYMYLHLVPWRRHLLLLRDDMRVQLLSSRDSFDTQTSGWHGEHTNFGLGRSCVVDAGALRGGRRALPNRRPDLPEPRVGRFAKNKYK